VEHLVKSLVINIRNLAFVRWEAERVCRGTLGLTTPAATGTAFMVATVKFNGATIRKNGVQPVAGALSTHTVTGITLGAQYDNTSPLPGGLQFCLSEMLISVKTLNPSK
jgi:hypothetical protein